MQDCGVCGPECEYRIVKFITILSNFVRSKDVSLDSHCCHPWQHPYPIQPVSLQVLYTFSPVVFSPCPKSYLYLFFTALCLPGYFSPTGAQPCSPCPVGYYQNDTGSHSCLPCPPNTRSILGHAESIDDCKGKFY